MVIGDLIICSDVIHAPPHFGAALWKLAVKPKAIDCRRMGWELTSVQFAIKKARQRGIKRIYGSLTQEDINNNPNLVKWYEKHGFEILPPSAENIENTVCGISLDLE